MDLAENKNSAETVPNIYIFFIILFVFFLTYMPIIQGYYVHHDDNYYWAWGYGECSSWPTAGFSKYYTGRPFGAYIICSFGWLFKALQGSGAINMGMESANYIRGIGIVSVSVLAYLFFIWLRQNSLKMFHSLLLVVCIFTLPPFQSMLATISNIQNVITTVLTVVAFFIAMKSVNTEQKNKSIRYAVLSILLLLIVLLTYQSSMMFFWTMLAVLVLQLDMQSFDKMRKKIIYLFCIGFAAILAYYPIAHQITKGRTDPNYDFGLVSDIYGKIIWFFNNPVVDALNLWHIFNSSTYTKITAFIILLGAAISFANAYLAIEADKKNTVKLLQYYIFKYFLVVSLVALSSLPHLASRLNFAPYRSIFPLAVLTAIFLFWALRNIALLFAEHKRERFLTAALVIGTLLGTYNAHNHLMNYYVFPQTLELRFIKSAIAQSAIAEGNLSKIKKIHVIHSAPAVSYVSPSGRNDEFGTAGTTYPQDIKWIVYSAIDELGIDRQTILDISWGRKEDFKGADESTLVIDMTRLSHFY